jgi:S-phase kinase-associated protein 1
VKIPLKDIEGQVLKPIVEWMVYHSSTPSREISRPLRTANLIEIVGVWDAEFIDAISLELNFKVLLAANYLNLQNLLELCCAKVASLMLGKTPKQIRSIFSVRDDFTAEEENQIRQEYAEFL